MKAEFRINYDPKTGFVFNENVENVQPFLFQSFENNLYRFFLKGVILNFKHLVAEYGTASNCTDLISYLYEKFGSGFSSEFSGEFCGYLYDKREEKLFVFANLSASQTVFYHYYNRHLFIDTDLLSLKNSLDKHAAPYSADIEAAYCLLTLNSLPGNLTLLKDVKKLSGGEQLFFDAKAGRVAIEKIEDLSYVDAFSGNKQEAIHTLEDLFIRAVRQEYDFDLDRNLEHFALLSGGLDSRIGLLYAKNLGYSHHQALCFSHSGYWDETIATTIAEREQIPLKVVHLDGGDFLKNIDRLCSITQGLTNYTGGVHSEYALSTIDFSGEGLIHSGHLGDAVLGSYLSSDKKNPASAALYKMIASKRYLPKIEPLLSQLVALSPSEEAFLLYNRGFNFINVGNYVAENFSIAVSPFMHNDFLRFALSLPEKWRFNENIYIEWIRECSPAAANYIWERTLMRPDKVWKTRYGDQLKVRLYHLFFDKILNRPYACNMAPYEYYFKTNLDIAKYFDLYFSENIHLIQDQPLKNDCIAMYQTGGFNEKTMVLSLLGSYKLLFG